MCSWARAWAMEQEDRRLYRIAWFAGVSAQAAPKETAALLDGTPERVRPRDEEEREFDELVEIVDAQINERRERRSP